MTSVETNGNKASNNSEIALDVPTLNLKNVDPNEAQVQDPSQSQSQTTASQANEGTTEESTKSVVTIFDVATEIEEMLSKITEQIDESDKLLLSKVEKIGKTLDKVEAKVRAEQQK